MAKRDFSDIIKIPSWLNQWEDYLGWAWPNQVETGYELPTGTKWQGTKWPPGAEHNPQLTLNKKTGTSVLLGTEFSNNTEWAWKMTPSFKGEPEHGPHLDHGPLRPWAKIQLSCVQTKSSETMRQQICVILRCLWHFICSNRKQGDDSPFLYFLFVCFNYYYYYFTLQYCIGFAIHQHASTMGVHVYFCITNWVQSWRLYLEPRIFKEIITSSLAAWADKVSPNFLALGTLSPTSFLTLTKRVSSWH